MKVSGQARSPSTSMRGKVALTGKKDLENYGRVTAADLGSEFLPWYLAKEMEHGNNAAGPRSVFKFACVVTLLFVIFSSLTPAGIFIVSPLSSLTFI